MINYILPKSKNKIKLECPISNLKGLEVIHHLQSLKRSVFFFKSEQDTKVHKMIISDFTPLRFYNHIEMQRAKSHSRKAIATLKSNVWLLEGSDFLNEMYIALTNFDKVRGRKVDEYIIVTKTETIQFLEYEPDWEIFDIQDLHKEIKKVLDFDLTDEL